MSMGSRIRRVTARMARLFVILSSLDLFACASALAQALSQISGTVKESRHDDRRGEITSDATPPSATTAPYRVLQLAMNYLFWHQTDLGTAPRLEYMLNTRN